MRALLSVALIALAACMGLATAGEPEKFGIYAGAEVGSAKSSMYVQTPVWQQYISGSNTGWGLFAGFRQAKFLGLEVNYLNFGQSEVHNISDGAGNTVYNATTKSDALGIYAIGYLPLPANWDLFGKAGYANVHTQTSSNGNFSATYGCTGAGCVSTPIGVASTSESHNSSDFAWGIGAEYRLGPVSVRAEYQKIEGSKDINSNGSPSLLSVGAVWHF